MPMITHDPHKQFSVTQSIAPGAKTATVAGSAADMKDCIAAFVIVDAGAWTDGSHTITVSSCATSGGSFAPESNLFGSPPVISSAPNGSQVYVFSVDLTKALRFLKVISTVSGATTGAVYGAAIVGITRAAT